jgi:hypothetical protein
MHTHQEVVVEEALVVAAVPAELVELGERVAAGLHALHGRGALVAAAPGLGEHAGLERGAAAGDRRRGRRQLLPAQAGLERQRHRGVGAVLHCARAGRRK